MVCRFQCFQLFVLAKRVELIMPNVQSDSEPTRRPASSAVAKPPGAQVRYVRHQITCSDPVLY